MKSNPSHILPTHKLLWSSYVLAVLLIVGFWCSQISNVSFSTWQLLNLGRNWTTRPFLCQDHQYTTEIVSVDPLLIYINNFVTASEAKWLIAAGEPNLQTSEIEKRGLKFKDPSRTSQSGPLPLTSPIVQCIISRATSFMGVVLPNPSDFSIPQLVRYKAGEKFDTHHDWYGRPEKYHGGWFDRVASFFVYLDEEGIVGGETWFPRIEVGGDDLEGKWGRRVEGEVGYGEGGTVFVPRKGNALFWVNLFANGTGDGRVVHAGLPLREGRKTAMNLWPRRVYRKGW